MNTPSSRKSSSLVKWIFIFFVICVIVVGYYSVRYTKSSLSYNKTQYMQTAISYNNIATKYYKEGKPNKALDYFQRSVKIHEKVLGKEDKSTSSIYNNIASIYFKMGDYNQALNYYQRALKIYEQIFGKEDIKTATGYNNMATTCKIKDTFSYYTKEVNKNNS